MQETSRFDWQFPYATKRIPVYARNVVATSQPLAAQAGLQMLYRGGNAVDAALATAIMLTVVEPVSNGLGSDAFCIVWDGKSLHGLNASGRSPAAWNLPYFQGLASKPERGWDTVTVPGAVSAWRALSGRFGRLPFADLCEPAIRVARDGYLVSPIVQQKWQSQVPILKGVSGFSEAFMPHGRAPHVGELFRFPHIAESLERIARSGGEDFYRGELAHRIVASAKAEGGLMREADLANHQCDWVEPISVNYRGYTLHEIPPNGQGITALMALGMLEEFDLSSLAPDGIDSQHLQIEAIKLAFADVYAQVSDPASMQIKFPQLLDKAYLKQRAGMIDRTKAKQFSSGFSRQGGTIYLTAADASGMMVSFIQSNYMGFGSGVVVPGTGISLQNRGAGFVLEPNHPNVVAGAKRPFHTIIPAFLTREGQPVMSFGVMGGSMQPQGHVQTLVRMLDYRQNPQVACDAPRWRFDGGLKVNAESTMSAELLAGLKARGHAIESINDPYLDYGSGQFIWRSEEGGELTGYIAASDARRDGQAVGF